MFAGGREEVYKKCIRACNVKCVCGRYSVRGLKAGGWAMGSGGPMLVLAADDVSEVMVLLVSVVAVE